MKQLTRIDVIRHGEPEGGRRYRGHGVDDPLTETGWQQMWDAVGDLDHWDLIITSPLTRCLDFSLALGEKLDIPVIVNDDIREIGFGAWEGLTPDEVTADDPHALERFYHDPINNRPDGAEPLQAFSDRVWRAYRSISEAHRGEHALVVAHAGVARAVMANILEMPLDDVYSRLKIEYAAIISTQVDSDSDPQMVIRA